MAYKSS